MKIQYNNLYEFKSIEKEDLLFENKINMLISKTMITNNIDLNNSFYTMGIMKNKFNGVFLIATNPVDIMTYLTQKYSEPVMAGETIAVIYTNKEDSIKEAEKLFTNLADAIKPHVGNISHTERIKATYEKTVKAIEDSKAAQAAVDAGKPVDPDFIAEVVAIFKNGLKRADAEYASWASWKYDDGDSGAAFEMEKYKTMNAAAVYLSNCNWRAYVNGREVASWKTTESEKALENALSKTFNATCADLNIEIIK